MDLKDKIIEGDCVEVLSSIPSNTFDMVITSPPYDNLRKYKGFSFNFEKIAENIFRTLKPGRVLIWVVNDATIDGSETFSSFKQAIKFNEIGFKLHDTMIFRKTNPIPQIYRKRYNNEFEYMFVFSKGRVDVHNPIKVPCLHGGLELKSTTYKNYSAGIQKRKKPANPVKDSKIKGNIWEYVVGKNLLDKPAKNHPAPFPVKLAMDHIISWTNKGDLILDPMCGSGTSCVAAKLKKRFYTGIDISKEYCDVAKKRIENTLENLQHEIDF
tara:strand:+ start:58 stop:864 length:807 start_codon:yes stop_codon:yes gene_type:complete